MKYWTIKSLVPYEASERIMEITVVADNIIGAIDKATEAYVRIKYRAKGYGHYAQEFVGGIDSVQLTLNDIFLGQFGAETTWWGLPAEREVV